VISARVDPALGEKILRSLPDWFGIESAIQQYVLDASVLPTFFFDSAGFLTLRENEIHVMAVSPEFHRAGVGRALLVYAETYLRQRGFSAICVKTISPARECAAYELTRKFYFSLGFTLKEELPLEWGAHNPCWLLEKRLT
jgi:GNAT superfamily N-acetyltransferase